MAFKFSQINLARSYGGTHELMNIIEKWGLEIICIQEPYQRKISWPDFRAFSGTPTPAEMWTLTLMKEDVANVVLIHDCSSPKCTVVRLSLGNLSAVSYTHLKW